MHWLIASVAVCVVTQAAGSQTNEIESAEIIALESTSAIPSSSSYSTSYFNLPEATYYTRPLTYKTYNRRSAQATGVDDTSSQNALSSGLGLSNQQFATGFGQPGFGAFQPGPIGGGIHGFPPTQGAFGGIPPGLGGVGGFGHPGSNVFFGNHRQQQLFGHGLPPLRPQFPGAFPHPQSFPGGRGNGNLAALGFGRGAHAPQMFLPGGHGGFHGGNPLMDALGHASFSRQPHFGQHHFRPDAGLISGSPVGFGGPNLGAGLFPQQHFNQAQFQNSAINDQTARNSFIYSR